MNEVWVVLYASGYTSETYTKIYTSYTKAYNMYIGLVENNYNRDDVTLDEVLKAIEDGELIDTEDVTLDDYDLTWDGSEVYERIDLYKQEVR